MLNKVIFGLVVVGLMACGKGELQFVGSLTRENPDGVKVCVNAWFSSKDAARLEEEKKNFQAQDGYSETTCDRTGATGICTAEKTVENLTAKAEAFYFAPANSRAKYETNCAKEAGTWANL